MCKNVIPTGIEAQVCADISERQKLGIVKYGVTVADNPLALRAWLVHAYEEGLDQVIYLKRAIAEIDATTAEVERLRAAIERTLLENSHLADGDNCTLILLKQALGK